MIRNQLSDDTATAATQVVSDNGQSLFSFFVAFLNLYNYGVASFD